ncbi:MAG TPA: hypothetical protein VFT66_00565 [Roseiflexaceae bacterium]|jgi:hypothetical protein|nr:hypothetical protein [Roseiflexaceae bacterium]
MRRALTIIALVTTLFACGAGFWAVRAAALASFILPGATNVNVSWQTLGGLRITYHNAGAPFAWRDELGRRLSAAGWHGRGYPNVGAKRPPFVTVWYTHDMQLGFVVITERAVFGGDADDPTRVIVDVSRELHLSR